MVCKPNLYVYALMMESKLGCSITMHVKSIESDSHSASYASFMLDTINATIFKLILSYGYWPGS